MEIIKNYILAINNIFYKGKNVVFRTLFFQNKVYQNFSVFTNIILHFSYSKVIKILLQISKILFVLDTT